MVELRDISAEMQVLPRRFGDIRRWMHARFLVAGALCICGLAQAAEPSVGKGSPGLARENGYISLSEFNKKGRPANFYELLRMTDPTVCRATHAALNEPYKPTRADHSSIRGNSIILLSDRLMVNWSARQIRNHRSSPRLFKLDSVVADVNNDGRKEAIYRETRVHGTLALQLAYRTIGIARRDDPKHVLTTDEWNAVLRDAGRSNAILPRAIHSNAPPGKDDGEHEFSAREVLGDYQFVTLIRVEDKTLLLIANAKFVGRDIYVVVLKLDANDRLHEVCRLRSLFWIVKGR